jgi:DNA polymerase I
MGGCIGFLKTLRKLTEEMQPRMIYTCWESGGSARRRALYPQYKLNRQPAKLNRFYEDDIPDTDDNKQHQLEALIHMTKNVPICQLYTPDCEGDDLVAYLCRGALRDANKIVLSSDKDMNQLLDDNTKIYSLHKKTFVTVQTVIDEFRVLPKHFALAKSLCGDSGDNVPGIRGMGFKTVARLFPILGLADDLLVQDVVNYAQTHVAESKIFKRVVDQQADVHRNWQLVHLDGSMLSATQQHKLDDRIAAFVPRADRIGLIKCLIKEGVGDFNVIDFFDTFNCIEGIQLKTTTSTVQ